jgi:serine protease Do
MSNPSGGLSMPTNQAVQWPVPTRAAQTSGALVIQVFVGGPADRAGVKVGDVIISFDGHEIKKLSDLPGWIARLLPNKPFPIIVRRNGRKKCMTMIVR